jgi:hypothetical protein
MRQLDTAKCELKKMTDHCIYLESAKADLEARIIEKQK